MKLQSITGDKYIINEHSSMYNNLADINKDDEYILFPYDNICFEEIINIKNIKCLNPKTFELIDLLDLNYLLFNNDIIIDSEIEQIKEIKNIKEMKDNAHKLNRILIYLNYSPYYKFDFMDDDTVDDVCAYGYVKILDWFISQEMEIKHTKHAINLACHYGHINILNWFIEHKLELIYAKATCEGRHIQQAIYSTFHDALTQICFGCKRVRSNIKGKS